MAKRKLPQETSSEVYLTSRPLGYNASLSPLMTIAVR